MNLEFLIARRVGVSSKKAFSKAILRLAVVSIALSMTIMIVATATVKGFKSTISEKIFGFWGHIHISSSYAPSTYAFEATPLSVNQDFYPSIDTIRQVNYTQEVINWPQTVGQNITQPLPLISLCLLGLMLFFLCIPKRWLPNLVAKKRGKINLLLALSGLIVGSLHVYELVPQISNFQTEGGIQHIQVFAQKEGIIKTKDQIEGIVLRGVGKDYNWKFLKRYITVGDTINTSATSETDEILISETTASRLKLKVNDKFRIYFIQNKNALGRKFVVKGIFKTGLEEYDRRFALVDLRKIQQLNNWRPFHNYGTELSLIQENLKLLGLTPETGLNWQFTQNRMLAGSTFDLSDSSSTLAVIPDRIAKLRRIGVGDSLKLQYQDKDGLWAQLNYTVSGIYKAPDDPTLQKTVLVNWNSINNINQQLPAQVSGFELFTDNINDLDPLGSYVNYVKLVGKDLYASTIKELEPNIFDWLSLTDMNERIILLLMILVSIINMTTSLMILILERTNMIGILKALGAQNWTIRKIFLYNASYIIGYGLLWGNIIGIGLCLIQQQFGIVTLPEDMYYISQAPIELSVSTILMLNAGTLTITLGVLIIPSWLVSRIDPVKAIRFS